jgi:hypothetical protein
MFVDIEHGLARSNRAVFDQHKGALFDFYVTYALGKIDKHLALQKANRVEPDLRRLLVV